MLNIMHKLLHKTLRLGHYISMEEGVDDYPQRKVCFRHLSNKSILPEFFGFTCTHQMEKMVSFHITEIT